MQYQDPDGRTVWLEFAAPERVISAASPDEVSAALETVDTAVQQGQYAAGYLTYEAATGLSSHLVTCRPGPLPLLRFGLYSNYQVHTRMPVGASPYSIGDWQSSLSKAAYRQAIEAIKGWIAQGDTYQVNFTFRLHSTFTGDPGHWFQDLFNVQRPRYAAYIADEEQVLLSASPELFFQLDGDHIIGKPMKGTAARGLTNDDDRRRAEELERSEKNRAENLMIVDMMRNDVGRIAETGSVEAAPLFEVERYPTLLQMTSTVKARTHARLPELIQALFPSCSITGAPKVRTMALIKELETAPRGIYTGSMGFLMPHHPVTRQDQRFAQFNVAIRTAHIQRAGQQVTYGTGGGIVWDSQAEKEYDECRTKALILRTPPHSFSLLETMRWSPVTGVYLRDQHLRRVAASAAYFGFPCPTDALSTRLTALTRTLQPRPHRIRLLLDPAGAVQLETAPITRARTTWRVVIDTQPVTSTDRFLYHKTTHRLVYQEALARHPDADDVVLWNEREELTESCLANIALRLEGQWYTPPIEAGLLDGTLRHTLVQRGRLAERRLTVNDWDQAESRLLLNSVRGFIRVLQ